MSKTDTIKNLNAAYSDELKGYREFAEARRKNCRFTQEQLWPLYLEAKRYFTECKQSERPLTIGGLTLRLGVTRKQLKQMKDADFDFRVPQYISMYGINEADIREEHDEYFGICNPLKFIIDESGNRVLMMTYSEVIGVCLSVIETENEEALFGSKPIGRIFYLKSLFGYSDSPTEAPLQSVQLVANRETAEDGINQFITEEAARRSLLLLESDKIEAATTKYAGDLIVDEGK